MNKRDMYLHRAKLFSHFFRDEQTWYVFTPRQSFQSLFSYHFWKFWWLFRTYANFAESLNIKPQYWVLKKYLNVFVEMFHTSLLELREITENCWWYLAKGGRDPFSSFATERLRSWEPRRRSFSRVRSPLRRRIECAFVRCLHSLITT
jgi:hypothetical protein